MDANKDLNSINYLRSDQDVDGKQILLTLLRNKRLIASITGISLLLGLTYALTAKRVWEGQFQIVIANQQSGSSSLNFLQTNPGLSSLLGGRSGLTNKLQTEVEILKSPSMLMPVFSFVKKTKKDNEGYAVPRAQFFTWLDSSLNISLKKGTSVLSLAYRDVDKELIVPVLNKISSAYQAYSGRDRNRNIEKGSIYLDEQISKYKIKSLKSLRAAESYAIENDLTIKSLSSLKSSGIARINQSNEGNFKALSLPLEKNSAANKEIDVETTRVAAANRIRTIKQQLKQLNLLVDDNEAFIFFGRAMPELSGIKHFKTLDNIEEQLLLKRLNFTENDKAIVRLLERKEFIVEAIKKEVIKNLEGTRQVAESILAASKRPKGVLVKYRELLAESSRDQNTLETLESQRRSLSLDKAFSEDPWQLITQPILLDSPVAPSRKSIVIFAFLLGISSGSGIAIYLERKKDLCYDLSELQSLINLPLLEQLSIKDTNSWDEPIKLLAQGQLSELRNKSIALITIGDIDQTATSELVKKLETYLSSCNVFATKDLSTAANCSSQLIITSMGVSSRNDLRKLKNRLSLQNKPVIGWISLGPNSDYLL